ncbi:hypothetical protein M9Y10_037995 [Tritrichomonas musculus]|uniref:Uncharacterized protein n=1 Tax=Tritrichomonas musculus TaxID=1915356 RepID=A0ABR2K7A8_9EUKA
MQRSNSNSHLDDSDNFGCLSGSGADLSRYQEQLARERNSRTLNLRHINRISIGSVLQNNSHLSIGAKGFIDPNNFPFLDSSKFAEAVNSNNIPQVTQYVQSVANIAAHSPRMLNTLLNQDFINFIINCFSNCDSEMLMQIMRFLGVVFPYCGSFQTQISEEIICSFFDLFDSTSPNMLLSTFGLISVMSSASSIARDSFITYGFHMNLIEIAHEERSLELTRGACAALYSIFSNNDPIDNEILIEIVPKLAELLKLHDKLSITNVIECFVEMTNKYNQLVFNLYECGIYPLSIEMLKDEELVGPTLHLVGDLSVAERHEVKVLIDNGVLPILNQLLKTEYVADAFWVLSNLLERTPDDVIPYCDQSFIQTVIDITTSSNYEIQKEGSFFLSTLIFLTPNTNLQFFMTDTILDILVQMINCGVSYFILRCIDTFIKILRYVQVSMDTSSNFFSELLETDLKDNLEELIESEKGLILDKAAYLLRLIDYIEKETKNE